MPPPPSTNDFATRFFGWVDRRPGLALLAAVLAALAPFLSKPLNMDDPLFVWAARQIQNHPANPYGFDVNWNDSSDTVVPMWKVTQNPPLTCYYLALSAAALGWTEPALHFACLLPALAAVWGTYRLARSLCGQPLLAAGATLFTPVFLVSSTSVMCDTMMLGFWVWAVALWVEGTERGDRWRLAGASLSMALAAMTKYFGVCLIPLLVAYTLIRKRRLGLWVVWFLIPAALLGVYEGLTLILYGQNAIPDAFRYSLQTRSRLGFSVGGAGLTALAFAGGCMPVAILAAPFLWRARCWAAMAGGGLLMVFLFGNTILEQHPFFRGSRTVLIVQIAFWAGGGICLLGLAAADVFDRRQDAASWLLALWSVGTLVFAAYVNWTVNGRSLLPMAPAAAILLARRMERCLLVARDGMRTGFRVSLVAGVLLALLVARSDFLFAQAVRRVVGEIQVKYGGEGNQMHFFGHWGFQYYMELIGAVAADSNGFASKPGDYIAVPAHNPTSLSLKPGSVAVSGDFHASGSRWLTTMNDVAGAGFYGSFWGPLPFAAGRIPPERAVVGVFVNP